MTDILVEPHVNKIVMPENLKDGLITSNKTECCEMNLNNISW